MTELDQPPELKMDKILAIFRENFYPSSQAQIEQLILGLSNLNRQFLFFPHNIPQNLNEYLLPMFNNPPNNEIMGLCSKCIVKALTADKPNGIEPSNFPFSKVIGYVKSDLYSKDTIKDLLEIIFSIVNIENSDSDRQIAEIANSDSNDIDIFFNYYNEFADSSKISCLKCIKNIVSNKVFYRFVIFLPNLLDIALSNYENQSRTLFNMAVKTFVIMSRYYLQEDIIKIDKDNQFDPGKYCDLLCELTSKYIGLKYLDVFIDSIRLCIHTFNFTIPSVLKRIHISAFFRNIEDTPVIRAAIKLILALMPYPGDKLTYIPQKKFNLNFADAFQNRDPSYSFNLNRSIQEIIPFICKIYYTNISLSLLCIQALTIFANTDNINLKLSNHVVYMMHFHLTDIIYTPYILSIISQCSKLEENRELIFKSRLIERLSIQIEENRPEDEVYNFYIHTMKELNYDPQKCKIEIDFRKLDINQFVSMIESNQLSPFDLLQIYYQVPNKNMNCFRHIKKLINIEENFDQIEDKAQVIVNFLLQMLADIPIPILCSDPYYGKYNDMLDDEITFANENGSSIKKVSLNSLLSEYNGNRNHPPVINDLIANNEKNLQIGALFNLDEILAHNNTYLYEIIHRELSFSRIQQYKIDNIVINDSEQFIINILPKIISTKLDELIINKNLSERVDLDQMIHEQFQIKIENLDRKAESTKKNDLICKLRLMKNQEIIQDILDVLDRIYERDKMHKINFINQSFLDNILVQTKYLFLSMGLYSPCSQLMVKYPFLFRINERHFLMQLLVKEPFMAKELFLKDTPHHERRKSPPHAQVKFIINRENIFKEGILILERFAKYRAFLDISFHNEKGFGDGPTREFFHLMSREFCEKRHRLWRRSYQTIYKGDENENELLQKLYVQNEQGLFPWATANSRYMHALGLFIAKAIQMEQIIDIPFNPAFFDIAAGREVSLADVDQQLVDSISSGYYEGMTFTCNVEDRAYNIVKNGENIDVTEENFGIYKKALKAFICGKHVKKKIDCFIKGFSEVLDPIILTMFTGKEMLTILDGNRELFTTQTLTKYITCENGYSFESQEIQNFIDIITSLEPEEQKYFIQFVTGYPYLPFGGLAALDPPITVARKVDEDEHQLPTASTCFNRLKLPPYSSKEEMEQKIKMAITECKGSFDLS